MANMRIYLIGMMGSGKSTVAQALGEALNLKTIDLDSYIEEESGHAINDIFKLLGENWFRCMERESLMNLSRTCPSFVMATGGGTPCYYDNMKHMQKSGITIYLNLDAENLIERADTTHRPLIQDDRIGHKLFVDMLEKRKAIYNQAQMVVYVNKPVEKIVKEIISNVLS